MNKQEIEKYIEEFKNFTNDLLKSKENCVDFLVRAGILNDDESLSENYK